MAKTHTNICIDPEAYALAQANIPNLSRFVNDSILAACSNTLSKADQAKIPREKILEAAIRELTNKLKAATEENKDLKKKLESAKEKYDRLYKGRKRQLFA